jgi:hypothetical protein
MPGIAKIATPNGNARAKRCKKSKSNLSVNIFDNRNPGIIRNTRNVTQLATCIGRYEVIPVTTPNIAINKINTTIKSVIALSEVVKSRKPFIRYRLSIELNFTCESYLPFI